MFTAEALGVAKPKAEAFQLVCEALDLAPQQVLYVGDDHEVDALAAPAAGLQAIHLDRLDAGPPEEVQRISSLAGLAASLVVTVCVRQVEQRSDCSVRRWSTGQHPPSRAAR